MTLASICGDPRRDSAAVASFLGNHACQHAVQLYSNDEFLIDVLSRRIARALLVEEPVLVIATAPHAKRLEQKLATQELDVPRAIRQGRYVRLDASETLDKLERYGAFGESCLHSTIGEILEKLSGPQCGQSARVSVFGEMVALLWAQGRANEAIQLEQLWNDLAKKYPLSLLCAYPVSVFNDTNHAGSFLKMCNEHSEVVPTEEYWGLDCEQERLRVIAQWQRKAFMFEQGTVMRQAEDQFRLLVEAVEDYAIFMLDPRGYVSSWNVGAQRIKQFEAWEIIGRHFSCFYPEEDVRKGKPDWELGMAERHGRFEVEDWRMRKDGSRFWANVIITALRNRKGELVGFGKVTRDVTEKMHAQKKLEREVAERRDAERQLHVSEKSLRELSQHLLRTQDEERRQIGRDLHDSLGQYLAVLKMKLDSLSLLFGQTRGPAAQDLVECVHLTDDCIKEVRTASYLLYPPMLEELGLQSAIPWYLDGFSRRSGVKTTFTVEAEFGRISRDAELALFRVLQEGLTNVHRHSGSETACVRLSVGDGFCALEIADEGVGIPQQFLERPGEEACAFGVGLRGMSERVRQLGGRLEVVSNDKGTILRAIVPTGESCIAGSLD